MFIELWKNYRKKLCSAKAFRLKSLITGRLFRSSTKKSDWRSAGEKKAFDLVALDLREIASFTEFFIVASGANQRQVQAIADEIEEQLKKQSNSRPVRTEGYTTAEWVLMDYGDFIVHIFEKNAREFYDLERLWRDARRVELPADL
jgi:ribosome-associated protein